MKNKKLLVLAAFALVLTGCGNKNNNTSTPDSSSANPTSVATSDATTSDVSTSLNNLDSSISSSVVQGTCGKLTSKMIEEIGNASITVDGVLTDYYIDGTLNETVETEYNMKVEMADGAWKGSYWQDEKNIISENFRRGEIVSDGKSEGAGLNKVYINKNNVVDHMLQKTFDGYPLFWSNQHYWNHLSQLNINKFEKDDDINGYSYRIDPASQTDYSEDQYLMAYLGQSLTSLLSTSDGLIDTLYVYCDDEHITKMEMFTEVAVLSTDADGKPVDQSFTKVELTFSDIGTTTPADPAPYTAGINNDKLANALSKMKGVKNFTFQAVNNTTYAPSTDEGDYELESASSSAVRQRKHNKVSNTLTSSGTVGRVGKVTEDAILFADTGKYTASLDDRLYHTEYSGLKQNADNTYDEFAYSSAADALVGTAKFNGNIFDKMPSFDLAPEIFEFNGGTYDKNGNQKLDFVLRDSSIAQDVAMQISADTNAKNATSSMSRKVTVSITIDSTSGEANLVSTSFPYSISSGVYLGYVSTNFYDVGTTVLDADLFDGYQPRVVKESWSEYTDVNYYPTSSNQVWEKKSADKILEIMYGDEAKNFVTPKEIVSIFGDVISGPWHETSDKKNDAGEVIRSFPCFSFNLQSVKLDNDNRITDWTDLMDKMNTVLSAKGYAKSEANSIDSINRKFCTFINGNIEIVFENIGYKTIYVSCYVTGDWLLNR